MRLGLIVRALRWRSSATTVGFTVCVAAFAAAAVGPIFLAAADDSVLHSTLAAAPAGVAGLTIVSGGGDAAARRLTAAADAAPVGPGDSRWFGGPILTADLGVEESSSRPGDAFRADLLSRTGICARLRFAAGSCPNRPGEIAVSGRSAALADLHLGAYLPVAVQGHAALLGLRIVGVYDVPTSVGGYWWGVDYFAYSSSSGPYIELDPLVAVPATVLGGGGASTALLAEIPLLPRNLGPGDAAAVESALVAYGGDLEPEGLHVSTQLPSLLATAASDEHVMGTIVWAIVAQLVLLALLVLYGVVSQTVQSREREAVIARLRGFPSSSALGVALGEPLAVLLAAFPAGLLVAWAAVALLAPAVFVSGTPVGVGSLAVVDGLAMLFAGAIACAAATRPLWSRQPLPARTTRRSAGALDALAVALALAGLLALTANGSLASGQTDALAVLAPGLMALGAAVIGLRLARNALRAVLRLSADSTSTASFLALRQVARRPNALRQALALTVASAIVVFAVSCWLQSAGTRRQVAAFTVGAARVLTVTVPPGTDLVGAVRRADPSGGAMAAVVYSGPSETLLAVDATRLAAVAAWPSTLSGVTIGRLARQLAPPVPAPVVLEGSEVRMVLDVGTRLDPPPTLDLSLVDLAYHGQVEVSLGSLVPGRRLYVGSLQGQCNDGCRLQSVSPVWSGSPGPGQAARLDLALRTLSERSAGGVWRAVAFPRLASDWTTTGATVTSAAAGARTAAPGRRVVELSFPTSGLPYGPSVGIADVPARLPTIATSEFLALNPPSPPGRSIGLVGLDGGALGGQVVARVPALPQVGANAAVVDLTLAERAQNGPAQYVTDEVWLSNAAPASVLARLDAEGVDVVGSQSAAAAAGALDRSGIALADTAFLLVGPFATLLALGSTLFAMASEGRSRRRELAALLAVGVEARTIVRSLVEESWLVLALALFIGAGVGVGATALALDSLPELPYPAGFAVPRAFPVAAVALLVGALGLVVAVSGLAVALALGRRRQAGLTLLAEP